METINVELTEIEIRFIIDLLIEELKKVHAFNEKENSVSFKLKTKLEGKLS